MKKLAFFSLLSAVIVSSCNNSAKLASSPSDPSDTLKYAEETHFKNIQQLTFGGDNAEAYWIYDSKYLVFQRTNLKDGTLCDQIFVGKIPARKISS